MNKYNDDKYIVVDLETTGLDPFSGCEIIEIGITEIVNNKIGRNYSRLVKPKGIIPSHITNITSITNDMVEDAESLETVLPNFRKYVGDTTIIAHNAKFDLKFLNYYLDLLGLEKINNHHKNSRFKKYQKIHFIFIKQRYHLPTALKKTLTITNFFRLIQIRFFRLIFSHSVTQYRVLQYDVYANESVNIKLPNGYDKKSHCFLQDKIIIILCSIVSDKRFL